MIFFRKFKQICIGKVPERNYFHTIPTKGVEIGRDRREKLAIAHEKIFLNNSGPEIGKILIRTSCTINLKFEIVYVKWDFYYYLLLSLF